MGIANIFKKKGNTKPRILIESNSPVCNVQAIVEEDDRCVYFYLYGQPMYQQSYMKSCWVRNYDKAPNNIDIKSMNDGKAPLMHSECCLNPNGDDKLDRSMLEIIWFEEGDGAALLYNNEIISIIPSYSNHQFPGYSRDCIKKSQFAWPLHDESSSAIIDKVWNAKEFWSSWTETNWVQFQESYINEYEKVYGKLDKYYAIDGGKWPPKALLTFVKDDLTYIFTLGVSILPQPKVELYSENPGAFRRFEFGFVIETNLLNENRDGILGYISGQSSYPWSFQTWLGHGHTLPCDQLNQDTQDFPYMLLVNDNIVSDEPAIKYSLYRDDPVNLLWFVPITSEEREYTEKHGSELIVKEKLLKNEKLYVFRGSRKFNVN